MEGLDLLAQLQGAGFQEPSSNALLLCESSSSSDSLRLFCPGRNTLSKKQTPKEPCKTSKKSDKLTSQLNP